MDRFRIVQEDYKDDPWRVLVCCILLNQTSNKQVRPLIQNFFKKWPDPRSIINEDVMVISEFIKTTGFQNIKSRRIKEFSEAWYSGVRDPFKFPGVGDYGREAWRIFVTKDLDFLPGDKKLRMYLESFR